MIDKSRCAPRIARRWRSNAHPARCRALIGLPAALRVADQYAAALDELARAEPLAAAAGLGLELASIRHLRDTLHFSLGDLEGCLANHHDGGISG